MSDSPASSSWLEARFPEPSLYPRDPARRAEVEIFVDWFNRVWKRPPNLIADEDEKARARRRADRRAGRGDAGVARALRGLLDGRDYLFGDFGAADVIAFPFLKYAVFGVPAGDDERFHGVLVEHQPLGDGYPRLHGLGRARRRAPTASRLA